MAVVTHEIVQQLRAQDSKELKEIVQQQKQMLEANQKIMNQFMQAVLTQKDTQPSQKTGGGGKPRWQECQAEKKMRINSV